MALVFLIVWSTVLVLMGRIRVMPMPLARTLLLTQRIRTGTRTTVLAMPVIAERAIPAPTSTNVTPTVAAVTAMPLVPIQRAVMIVPATVVMRGVAPHVAMSMNAPRVPITVTVQPPVPTVLALSHVPATRVIAGMGFLVRTLMNAIPTLMIVIRMRTVPIRRALLIVPVNSAIVAMASVLVLMLTNVTPIMADVTAMPRVVTTARLDKRRIVCATLTIGAMARRVRVGRRVRAYNIKPWRQRPLWIANAPPREFALQMNLNLWRLPLPAIVYVTHSLFAARHNMSRPPVLITQTVYAQITLSVVPLNTSL